MKRFLHAIVAALALTLAAGSGLPAAASHADGRTLTDLDAAEKRAAPLSERLHASFSHPRSDTSLVIVQFAGPVEERWKREVERLGVTLSYYLPDFAFIAKLPDQASGKRLESLPFVSDVRPFHPADKLSPELWKQANRCGGKWRVAVVGFDPDEPVSRTARRLVPGARVLDSQPSDSPQVAQLSVDVAELERLAASDDILAVLPAHEPKLHNRVAADIVESDELASTGYTGKNQIVGVADTGLDTGNLSRLHRDLQGRVRKLIPVGRPGDASDPDGHGTHVAGSIVGTGKASGGKYKGMAPDAKLVFHAMYDEDGGLSGDLYEMWTEAYDSGARIHSDSWGVEDFGDYTLLAYLADRFLWEHPDMIALVAAGNAGDLGPYTVGSPATAKNVIAVGATESVQRRGKEEADDPDELAWFSSRGPTLDGRIKPDIVAPGTYILSTRSSLAPDSSFDARFNKYYAYMSGTSMAAPILAGGAAQIRQYLQERGHEDPSGALIKAMLLTGARDLGYSLFEQGFGRADLLAAIRTDVIDEPEGLSTHDRAVYTVKVTDPDRPFAVTLAWTDYPAFPLAWKTLVNDLHLVVTSPSGMKYNGNDFHAPHDDRTDKRNNVEQVYLAEPETGTYTVEVIGYNVPFGPQPYALATTGKWRNARTDSDLIDAESIRASVKMADGRYQISVKGSLLSPSVERVTVRLGGTVRKAVVRNGSFSLNSSVGVNGRYVEDLVVEATDKRGRTQAVTVPAETDLIADEPVLAVASPDEEAGLVYEVAGSWVDAKPAGAFVVADGQTIPLTVEDEGFFGSIPAERASGDAVVVAVDAKGGFEVEAVVFP